MEDERFLIVDPWQSYASPTHSVFVANNFFPAFAAGCGKSILWYVVF